MAIILESGQLSSGAAEFDPNIVDFVTVKEAMDETARRQRAAEYARDAVRHDLETNILLQNGGYMKWSNNMGYGPIVPESAAEYRAAWYEALEAQAQGMFVAESA
jgi:hypothetical protein